MSFILDALKKSEHERQRQAIPGLVEANIARSRQRFPIWAIALGGLLGINLIVLLIVLARGWMTAPPAPARVAAASATAAPGAADTAAGAAAEAGDAAPGTDDKQWSPLDNAPADSATVYAPEVPVTPLAPAAPPVLRHPVVPGGPALHPGRRRDPVLNDGDYKADQEETLPSVNELNLSGAQALPELHLDVHVFATNSAERFVFINMRKYHEGATLQEGPTVERIRRDGVILNYQGLRFLLPRQ